MSRFKLLIFAVMGIFFLAALYHQAPAPEIEITSSSLPGTVEQELVKEYAPGVKIPERGDVKGLKEIYKKHFGLILKDIESHADGSYSVVIQTAEETYEPISMPFSAEEQALYVKGFLSAANEGKKFEISERDRKEILLFRQGVQPGL